MNPDSSPPVHSPVCLRPWEKTPESLRLVGLLNLLSLLLQDFLLLSCLQVCSRNALLYGGPQLSRKKQITHGKTVSLTAKANSLTAKANSLTAKAIRSRQKQIAHGKSKFTHSKSKLPYFYSGGQ